MAVEVDKIRTAAERVAASHGLEVVDVTFTGAGKFRSLQVFIEKNAAGRAAMLTQAEELAGTDDAPVLPRGVAAEALSGVTHEDCATFAQDFGTLLDVEDLVPGSQEYTLEVSSPGIDRKLFKAADYERFAGSLVKVKTFQPMNGQKVLTGRMRFENGIVKLDLAAVKQKGKKPGGKNAEEKMIEIPLADVEKAEIVPEI
ncbi:MAG: ribosome maturation factor RimP [Acidobacteria bacterium]|nr:ribosome maturation factor RimP [Acidobacteriota bacterium]